MLTDASIEGKIDRLLGLKENVIIGKLIPAATGLKRYRSIDIAPDASRSPARPTSATRCSRRSRRSARTAARRRRARPRSAWASGASRAPASTRRPPPHERQRRGRLGRSAEARQPRSDDERRPPWLVVVRARTRASSALRRSAGDELATLVRRCREQVAALRHAEPVHRLAESHYSPFVAQRRRCYWRQPSRQHVSRSSSRTSLGAPSAELRGVAGCALFRAHARLGTIPRGSAWAPALAGLSAYIRPEKRTRSSACRPSTS